ncbi:MAG: hypothetical protein HY423_11635 [Candidatus Lambdaproteobacteria bacterium]|nr:hypothetical protein [Candidatus Lambdaproteobacteria bacterium]
MADIDQVAAARAGLQLMLEGNQTLLEHFQGLLDRLLAIEALPPAERQAQFGELVASGGLMVNGVDVRRYAQTDSAKPLKPHQFLRRTHRRMVNTVLLITEFRKRNLFPAGQTLIAQIDDITGALVDESNPRAVLAFRAKVEAIRQSTLFQDYLGAKKAFVNVDPDLRNHAEVIATREAVEEGKDALEYRADELQQMGDRMEQGELAPDDVLKQLESFASGLGEKDG